MDKICIQIPSFTKKNGSVVHSHKRCYKKKPLTKEQQEKLDELKRLLEGEVSISDDYIEATFEEFENIVKSNGGEVMNIQSENKDFAERKSENIETAKRIIKESGIKYETSFSGYSDTNGVSVYFKRKSDDKKIRVSDHSVSNKSRIMDEIGLKFDQMTIGIGGKIGFKSNKAINIFSANNE